MTDDGSNHGFGALNRRRLLAGVGAAGATALAGCSGGSGGGGGSGGSNGDTLNIAQVKSPIEFDPIVLNDVPSQEVINPVFEGLYTYNEDASDIVPELATGKPQVNSDGTRYVVEMTTDATFHNGDPVTPEDAKYTFEAPVAEETENASTFNMIDSITIPDDNTLRFDLKYPFGAFETALADIGIVPKSVRERDKQKFNKSKPIGSGPYKFDGWKEGDFADLVKNEGYWGEPKPQVSKIHFAPVEESTTRVTTLRNGQNDVIKEIPPKLYSTVRDMQDVRIDEVPGLGYFYLAFNCKEGPTADPVVREAVDYCFSMDQAVTQYVEPTGVRQYSPFPEAVMDSWGFPADRWKQIPHGKNIDEANRLFDRAGVSKSYDWTIIVPPDDKREQIGVSVSNGLKEAGFENVSVQRLAWNAFLEKYVSGAESDYNMYTLGWSGSPDPDAFTYYMFGRDENTLGVTQGTYYGENSQRGRRAVDKIMQARETRGESERTRLYTDAVTTILEDRAHLPAYNLKNSFAVKNYVKGFSSHPSASSFQLSTKKHNVSLQ